MEARESEGAYSSYWFSRVGVISGVFSSLGLCCQRVMA